MPKKLYERGPAMDPPRSDAGKRMFEGPSLQQIDQTKRGHGPPRAIEKSRDMIRKRVGIPPRSNGAGKPISNDSSPPIKSKFE